MENHGFKNVSYRIEYGKGNGKLHLEQEVVEKCLKNFECLNRFQFITKIK